MKEEEDQNPFYDQLCQLIGSTQKRIKSSPHHYAALREDTINYIEGAFYANLVRLFQKNLNEKFFRVVNMSRKDRQQLLAILRPYFDRANATYEEIYNKGEVDFQMYQDFRRAIYEFGDDAYWLLLGVERYADVIRCEHRIIQFKNELLDMER
ncbi:hypothetical protein B6U90_02975 [Thermoplasmatales archaeon ex4484_6]|nr:MAG: hypothetical protein B6U90_02975 [Thermoplasmatales archaeon ex4484_6]